jgi:predicted amidophosphoribosyltransferase
MFERRQIVALKKCPNCDDQLPLSAVLCDACDYNFLSEMVGHGQKLLPSPEVLAQEMTVQRYEYRA